MPEVFDFIGGSRAEKFAAAEILRDGPAYKLCRELAIRHGVFIHAGSILEKIPMANAFTTQPWFSTAAGAEIARYRKIHMFDITAPDGTKYHESAAFTPGEQLVTYDCEDMTIGCAICYDLRFPELFRRARGAAAPR